MKIEISRIQAGQFGYGASFRYVIETVDEAGEKVNRWPFLTQGGAVIVASIVAARYPCAVYLLRRGTWVEIFSAEDVKASFIDGSAIRKLAEKQRRLASVAGLGAPGRAVSG